MLRRSAFILVAGLGLASCGGSDDETGAKPTLFYDLARPSNGQWLPLTADYMVTQSDSIVVGRMVDVDAGMTIHYDAQIPRDDPTIVVDVEVERVLKGPSESHVYVNLVVHAANQEGRTVPTVLPHGTMALFLAERSLDSMNPSVDFVGATNGYPEGETLYALMGPQALMVEGATGVEQPLVPTGPLVFPGATTIADVVAEVEARVQR